MVASIEESAHWLWKNTHSVTKETQVNFANKAVWQSFSLFFTYLLPYFQPNLLFPDSSLSSVLFLFFPCSHFDETAGLPCHVCRQLPRAAARCLPRPQQLVCVCVCVRDCAIVNKMCQNNIIKTLMVPGSFCSSKRFKMHIIKLPNNNSDLCPLIWNE